MSNDAVHDDKHLRERLGFAFDMEEYNFDVEKLQEEAERKASIAAIKLRVSKKEASETDAITLKELSAQVDYKKAFSLFGRQKFKLPPIYPDQSSWILQGDNEDSFNHGLLRLVPQQLSFVGEILNEKRTIVESDLRNMMSVTRETDLTQHITYLDPHAIDEV